MVMVYVRYHKSQEQVGAETENIRFLPRAIGDLLLTYLALVVEIHCLTDQWLFRSIGGEDSFFFFNTTQYAHFNTGAAAAPGLPSSEKARRPAVAVPVVEPGRRGLEGHRDLFLPSQGLRTHRGTAVPGGVVAFYTFNAGLVIFAAMQVAHDDCRRDPDRVSRWKFVEDALPYFNIAIEALQNLDRGNRVVERCVNYLSQLSLGPITAY
ncbi:hypothetical protein MRS44_017847 [Fusarium solani]|uniref:uncharacterized protein n=1 Tax=Fusarium solani TaxID=169388 RepID=UPI0032C496B0|nr:hypothetical protein MRS44_017847 [Fusarium solani]